MRTHVDLNEQRVFWSLKLKAKNLFFVKKGINNKTLDLCLYTLYYLTVISHISKIGTICSILWMKENTT